MPPMRVLFVEHAKQRMAQRGITEDEVKACLFNPDTTVPADQDRTRYIQHSGDGGSISVVAVIRKITDTHFVVYTVFKERGNHV